ncbi:LCP family protein [Aeromicrobium sp. CF4.19]|uniref:LCP family protein n=1 Tax=Aeromicrobium sp. CF4.19 TaxID=3373082 RepID=UPI003EE4DAE5
MSDARAEAGPSPTQVASDRIQFRRALTLTFMTLVMPGSAQLVMGNRRVGRIALRVWLGVIVAVVLVALLALTSRSGVFALFTNPRLLFIGRWFLILGAIAWVVLLLDAWRLGRPLKLRRGHRLWMTGVNAALCFGTAGVMFFAAHLVSVQNGLIGTVFASEASSDPTDGRYNVLLLGTDSGDGRDGMRPDSLQVASIDRDTGRTVLVGLPRNLQDVPFPEDSVMREEFPDGFDCDGCYLNAVNTWANDNAELFDEDEPGIEATMGAVEEITGLQLNYYALVNMEGFSTLIDAVGGVDVNVRERTAMDGIGAPISGYIEAGEQRLDGTQALWFARSRVENDDFTRMGRQKCLMSAMLEQLDPKTVLMNVQKIADSGKALLTTDVPASDLNVFMDLALKARAQKISSVSLTPPVIYTGNPDYPKVRRLVAEAVQKAEGKAPKPYGLERASLSQVKQVDPTAPAKDPNEANQSSDVAAAC